MIANTNRTLSVRSGADYHLLTRHLAQKKQAVESKLVEKAKQLSFPFRERIRGWLEQTPQWSQTRLALKT